MCGILYLIRLFVNHAERGRSSKEIHELLSGMEFRLYKVITVPAMTVSWIAGLGIIYTMPNFASQGWFHLKLLLVICMSAATIKAGRMVRQFAILENRVPTGRQLRLFNELPTILMLLIVAAVIFKPFSG
jgi:putative membrane protein